MTAPALSEFERLVGQLTTLGFPRDRAVAQVRQQFPAIAPAPEKAERDARVLEKTEQREVTKVFQCHGFTVRSTSQARPSKVAPGLPDLFVTHKAKPFGFFWETKRQVGGTLSIDQQAFADDCARCGIRWYTGDRYHAEALMRAEGFADLRGVVPLREGR
jgi:hypothetical protein